MAFPQVFLLRKVVELLSKNNLGQNKIFNHLPLQK